MAVMRQGGALSTTNTRGRVYRHTRRKRVERACEIVENRGKIYGVRVRCATAVPAAELGPGAVWKRGKTGERVVDEIGVGRGVPAPLGASATRGGRERYDVNFAVHIGAGATSVSLLLYSEASLTPDADASSSSSAAEESAEPLMEVPLQMEENRTGGVWHIELRGVSTSEPLMYAWSVNTFNGDRPGQSFSARVPLVDPYARAVLSRRREFGDTRVEQWPLMACAMPAPPGGDSFDWLGYDVPLNIPQEELVVYEAHVRGFSARAPDVSDTNRGTYLGMAEKLDHLQSLGVNCIELMPVHEFNEMEYYDHDAAVKRLNFWGYSTVNFFAPNARFSAAAKAAMSPQCDAGRGVVNEFKLLVRECHRRGIEVILDVVFNHTAEGNEQGPTISFRGLDNAAYYTLAPGGEYYNYSGCGNTFNCNHPVARQFIVDCLRYWVLEMKVDGFRFDLASIMTRANSLFDVPGPEPAMHASTTTFASSAVSSSSSGDSPSAMDEQSGSPASPASAPEACIAGLVDFGDGEMRMTDGAGNVTGTPLNRPPLIEMISSDPVLAKTKLIAEAWDADGLNQVGAFPHFGGRWAEWNGVYRDNVRNFVKGGFEENCDGGVGWLAAAVCGSLDMYSGEHPDPSNWWANNGGREWYGNRGQECSVNFVTAHDGFSLMDLVSYNDKHNDDNGEQNRDGENHNLSWNCGIEGPTTDPDILSIRERHVRNFIVALMLSQGVPMLTMGDEYGHTKRGNNNTYCHDDERNWFDWSLLERQRGKLFRFTKHMIHLRRSTPELRQSRGRGTGDISWHGHLPHQPDWAPSSKLIAFSMPITGPYGVGIYCCFNVSHEPAIVTLPPPPQPSGSSGSGGSGSSGTSNIAWRPFADTGKPAPFDVIVDDDQMDEREVRVFRGMQAGWTGAGQYPVMPRSCVVLLAGDGGEAPERDGDSENSERRNSDLEELRRLIEENRRLRARL